VGAVRRKGVGEAEGVELRGRVREKVGWSVKGEWETLKRHREWETQGDWTLHGDGTHRGERKIRGDGSGSGGGSGRHKGTGSGEGKGRHRAI
jgi:hypothetical protein